MLRKLVSASILIAIAPACSSDDGQSGSAREEVQGTSCKLEEGDSGSSTITCPDGTSVTLVQGEPGRTGKRGQSGKDGKTGVDGTPGENGDPGKNGAPGADGKRGVDGEPGAHGPPGKNGDPGESGLSGDPGADGTPGRMCSVGCADAQSARISCADGTEVVYAVRLCGDPPSAWLSVGREHACQVRANDGRLVCWGSDASQKLGNGAFAVDQVSASFVDTRTLPDGMATTWQLVSSGNSSTCGLTTTGDAYCWGAGTTGVNSWIPMALDMSSLPTGTHWSSLTSAQDGYTTCGITTGGDGYCWGSDSSGQRGDGEVSASQSSPSTIDTSALPPETWWSLLSAGRSHTCGLTTDGTAYCWGSDADERLGNGRLVDGSQVSPSAVDVSYLPLGTSWSMISAGDRHTCAVTTAGEAYCWGNDSYGQLGRNGVVGPSDYPRHVDNSALTPGTSWERISAGNQHSCGVATDGAAYCWGNAADGRLGDGSEAGTEARPVAVALDALPAGTTWVEVVASDAFSCGLTSQAAVYCWGSDQEGQLGNGIISGDQAKPEHRVGVSFGIFPDPVTDPSLVFLGVEASTQVVAAVGDPTNPSLLMTLLPTETPLDELVLSAASSNESVLPSDNINFSGNGTERTVSLVPAARGTSTVTFTVSNNSGEQISFPVDYATSAQPPHSSGRYHSHISDASSAIDVGEGYMLLANDETNRLFLHKQEESGPPVKVWDFVDDGTQLRSSEADIEGAARMGDQVLWITSHGNARDGDTKEYRRVLFATTITGSGAEVELNFSGRYGGGPGAKDDVAGRGLGPDIRTWDQTNAHGLGANSLGLAAAMQDGVLPNAPGGFNIEALEFAPDGTTGYLGFRAPTVDVSGTQHALIVPLTNILELVDGVGEQSGRAAFGDPIFLDLAGRSIRAMRRNASFDYLISAGPPDSPTPGVNDTWALYTWDGDPTHAPVLNQQLPDVDLLTGGTWESIASVPEVMTPGATFRLVTDSGDTDFYGTGQTKDIAMGLQKSYSQLFTLQ